MAATPRLVSSLDCIIPRRKRRAAVLAPCIPTRRLVKNVTLRIPGIADADLRLFARFGGLANSAWPVARIHRFLDCCEYFAAILAIEVSAFGAMEHMALYVSVELLLYRDCWPRKANPNERGDKNGSHRNSKCRSQVDTPNGLGNRRAAGPRREVCTAPSACRLAP